MMKTSEAGIKLIEEFEGLRLHIYKDIVGLPTIGYGHLIKPGEDFSDGITQAQAEALLDSDVADAEAHVNRLAPNCNQNQFDALVSFAYNCGDGSLAQMLSHGFDQVPNQILKWNHAGGIVSPPIAHRRQVELALFQTPVVSVNTGNVADSLFGGITASTGNNASI